MPALSEPMIVAKTRINSLHLIQNLNLWGNNIDDVSLLKRMQAVEVLSLSVNNIASLEPFGCLPNLQELYLRKNKISDPRELAYLSKCKRLKVLWLLENPVAQGPDYRLMVIAAVPWLHKLDNVEVTQAEILTAQERDYFPSNSSPISQQGSRPSTSAASSRNDHQIQHQQQQSVLYSKRPSTATASIPPQPQIFTIPDASPTDNFYPNHLPYPKTPAQQAMEAILYGSPINGTVTPAPTPLSPGNNAGRNRLPSSSVHHPLVLGSRNNGYEQQQPPQPHESYQSHQHVPSPQATDGASLNGAVSNIQNGAVSNTQNGASSNKHWSMEGKEMINQRIRANSQNQGAIDRRISDVSGGAVGISNGANNNNNGNSSSSRRVSASSNSMTTRSSSANVIQAILTLSNSLDASELMYLKDQFENLALQKLANNKN